MTAAELPDRTQAVTVAYVHQHEVAYSWHHSMVEMIGWDMANRGRIMAGGYIAMRCGTNGLTEARNKAVQDFLDEDESDWFFWIDTDMGFAPDTVDRLLDAADPVERPVVGGLCFTQNEQAEDGLGGWRTRAIPTLFDWLHLAEGGQDKMGFAVRWDYPPDTLIRVGGTGAACILIHRSVFEKIRSEHGPVWYDRVPNTTTGQLIGEDLSFCLRAGALQIPIHVHTGVKTTHLKSLWLADEDYRQQREPAAAPSAVVPPAVEDVAVIVPVMRRPDNAAPFMRALRASTGLARVYAVADNDDQETITAWRNAGAAVITPRQDLPNEQIEELRTFASKINAGYESTREPWLFVTGDDVRFQPGWLDHAQAVARDRYHVIGTNDLSNPRVMAGDHATHLLIRRSYVDEVGASWDGPKVVAHEGYRHWYVDDEIVTAAKQRGVWKMAITSRVEHLHPLFGKASSDEVYELGQSFAEQDKALFEQRVAEHAS